MALAVLAALACPHSALADDAPNPTTIDGMLSAIDARLAKLAPRDRQIAERLNAQGDAAYRKGDYVRAQRAYWNSYPNYPNAYAYIMAGDAYWREFLMFQRGRAGSATRDGAACPLNNRYFASDLKQDFAGHLDVGIALVKRSDGDRPTEQQLLHRAQAQSACLHELVSRYEGLSHSECVDLEALQSCLGPPLLR